MLYSDLRDRPVIFIVGTSRSGKTLVSRIFRNSPRVFIYRELHFFERLYQPDKHAARLAESSAAELYCKLLETQEKGILHSAQATEYLEEATRCVAQLGLRDCSATEVYQSFLHQYASVRKFGAIPCEQTGSNIFYVDAILRAFPNARIVNMIRDPRDVLISKKEKWRFSRTKASKIPMKEFVRQSLQYHPYIVSKLWVANVRAAGRFRHHPAIFTLRFEDLMEDRESCVRNICEFAGVEYSSDLLLLSNDSDVTSIEETARAQLSFRDAESWTDSGRMSGTELYICQRVAKQELIKFSYQLYDFVPNPAKLAWYLIILPVKLFLAVVVNKSRVGGLKAAIFRRMRNLSKNSIS